MDGAGGGHEKGERVCERERERERERKERKDIVLARPAQTSGWARAFCRGLAAFVLS